MGGDNLVCQWQGPTSLSFGKIDLVIDVSVILQLTNYPSISLMNVRVRWKKHIIQEET